MIKELGKPLETADLRELSLVEIEATSGAGIISFLKRIFGGNYPKPPRGPNNPPAYHLM
jgi:hypothetical protein